jgi:hypothetical protein
MFKVPEDQENIRIVQQYANQLGMKLLELHESEKELQLLNEIQRSLNARKFKVFEDHLVGK